VTLHDITCLLPTSSQQVAHMSAQWNLDIKRVISATSTNLRRRESPRGQRWYGIDERHKRGVLRWRLKVSVVGKCVICRGNVFQVVGN